MDRPDELGGERALVENSHDIITTIEADGTITFVNRAVESTLGYDPEQVVGTDAFDLIHEDDRAEVRDRFTDLIERPGEATSPIEHRMYHRDGSVRWVESVGSNPRETALDGYVINSRDVTDRKAHQEALENYRAFTEAIFDSFEEGFFVLDAGWNVIRWNQQVTHVTGYTPAEVASMTAADFVPEEHHEVVQAGLQEALATGSARFEADLVGKEGTRTAYEFTATRLEDPDGNTVIAGLGRDIGDRKRRQQQLRRLRRATEASGHAIYITDVEGRIEYVNPAFEAVTGYPAAEAVGSHTRILNSGEMDPAYYDALWETVTAGDVWEEEIVNRRKDGDLYTARQTVAPILDAAGQPDGFVAIQTDISEEKERLERLESFGQAIESSTELIAAADPDYRYLFGNDQYQQYHDIDGAAIERLSVDEVLGPEWTAVKPHVDRALSGEPVRLQKLRELPQGSERYFDIQYTPLREPGSEEVLGVLATMRDVTELHERQQQLLVLSRFLRHNLRNVLNVVLGRAELIRDAGDGDTDRDTAAIISASTRLLETATKTQAIKEIFAGEHALTPADPDALLSDVVADLRQAHPQVEIDLSTGSVSSVTASNKLAEALTELVTNAIEHNDSAAPLVEIETRDTGDTVEIVVADNGPGIPVMEREVLTSDRSEQPLFHAQGVGLWLVFWIVRRSGGRLRFHENEPRGSVVTVELPNPSAGPHVGQSR